jgi:hypothetical protein
VRLNAKHRGQRGVVVCQERQLGTSLVLLSLRAGVNSETCVLSSCICAERCALTQLRVHAHMHPHDPTHAYTHIKTVYITTTANHIITPGMLCREFMQEVCAEHCSFYQCNDSFSLSQHKMYTRARKFSLFCPVYAVRAA